VASVCAQTYPDLEVVIVDDGSPDDTAAVAARLAAGHPERTIRLVQQANQGLAAARNAGIRASSGEYVLPLDADDLLEPTFVEDLVRVLDARPDLSIVYGRQRWFEDINEFPPILDYDLALLTRRNLLTCTSLFRRRAWEDVGGYDEQLTAYEDWDFWLGCGERGHFALHVPHATFYYRRRNGGMLANARLRDSQLKAQLVSNHPTLFSAEETAWAHGVLAGTIAPGAVDVPDLIPSIGEETVRSVRSGGAFEGARRFATLAIADEILERPQLLSAYGAEFGAQDDASLIITGTEEQLARLSALVDELGLGGEDAADLIGALDDGTDLSLLAAATRVDALLTARPLVLPVPVPRVEETRLGDLRRLAGIALIAA
jgi:Glycosyl transferase family 2